MRQKLLLLILFALILSVPTWAERDTIRNEGLAFAPETITVTVGDTVVFDIGGSHNAVEVGKAAWDTDTNDPLADGFSLPLGGGEIVMDKPGTFYFICQPHISVGMKGSIVVEEAQPDGDVYVAELSGQQVTVPVLTQGSGSVQAVLMENNMLHVTGSFSDLSSPYTVSHFHIGYAGRNGGVAFALSPTLEPDGLSGTFDQMVTLDENTQILLEERQLYVNVHSQNFPGGELRGQAVPDADEIYYTKLLGSMEVPPVMSGALGGLVIEVHGDEFVTTGSFDGLESDFNPAVAGGAHLHDAPAGSNSGIARNLVVSVDPSNRGGTFTAADNTFALSPQLADALEERRIYANIHSVDVPSGEIRGQLHEYATSVWRAFLSGPQAVPPVNSPGHGQLLLELDGDDLSVSGSFSGLSSPFTVSHIHVGVAGTGGGVLVPLTRASDPGMRQGSYLPSDNQFSLTDEQVEAMLARGYYANIHSDSFPSGELRGQILPQAQYYFHGLLSGVQQPGGINTGGYGVLIAELTGDDVALSGSFNTLTGTFDGNPAGGAHLHYGLAGSSGGIALGLSPTANAAMDGATFPVADHSISDLRAGLLDSMKMRMLYANIHSTEYPGGEIRGQMLPEARAYLFAPLAGSSEVPAVNSAGGGLLVGEWTGSRLTMSGSFADLESEVNTAILGGAHLHAGLPGSNGGVRQPLTLELGGDNRSGMVKADANSFPLGSAISDTLNARLLYANIHTVDHPAGEIRGQLRAPAVRYFTTFAQGVNGVPPVSSTGYGAMNFELNGGQLIGYGAFAGLDGDFDGNPAGGVHLHYGTAASTGGIAVRLNATKAADNDTSGVFSVYDNVFTLDATPLDSLNGKNLYFNLHTTEVPSGEIRGLVLPESNAYPAASAITAPANGASLTIEGDAASPFVPEWDAVVDPDMDTVVYVWQLAASDAFDTPLVSVNVGSAPRFETDFGTVAALLQSAGVSEGETITVYHRVLSSDGSLVTPSEPGSVNLTLGIVTAFDEVLARKFQLSMYPVPANDWVQVNVLAEERANGLLQLFDNGGRLLARYPMELFEGENQQRLDLGDRPGGYYFLQLLVEGQPVPARKLFIQPD